jgi:hypothetical protein
VGSGNCLIEAGVVAYEKAESGMLRRPTPYFPPALTIDFFNNLLGRVDIRHKRAGF